jgi:hypothetical protein
MHWNYRILKHKHKNGDWFAIHEVYYDDKSNPIACSKDPDTIVAEDIKSIKGSLNLMGRALKKPVLDYEYFENMGKKSKKRRRNQGVKQ